MENKFIVSGILGFLVSINLNAQSLNDPTYSIRNYKHLNKAILAHKYNNEGVDNVGYRNEENLEMRNYKLQFKEGEQSGASFIASTVESSLDPLISYGNYKTHFGKDLKGEVLKPTSGETPVVKDRNINQGNRF